MENFFNYDIGRTFPEDILRRTHRILTLQEKLGGKGRLSARDNALCHRLIDWIANETFDGRGHSARARMTFRAQRRFALPQRFVTYSPGKTYPVPLG